MNIFKNCSPPPKKRSVHFWHRIYKIQNLYTFYS